MPVSPYSVRTFVLRRRLTLITSAMLATLASGFGLIPYYLIYRIAAEIIGRTADQVSAGTLIGLTVGALTAVLAKGALTAASGHLSHIAAYWVLYDVRIALADKLGTLPLGFFNDRATGTIKKVIHEDVEQLEEGLAHMVPDIVSGITAPLIALVVLALVDWRMALAAAATLPVTIAVFAYLMGREAGALTGKFNGLMARMNAVVIQYINGMKVIKAFTRTDASFAELQRVVDETHDFYTGLTRFYTVRFPFVYVLIRANLLTILPIGLALVLGGTLTVPTFMLFLLMGMGLNQNVFKVVWAGGTAYYQVAEAMKRVNGLLDEPSLTEPAQPRTPDGYDIVFEHVTFGYKDGATVLNGVSFTVPAGSVTALVGPSGAGKSTIAKLIPRFWDVTDGRITVGDVDVREIGTHRLMDHVAFVFQDVFLFNDTIYENIRVGKPDATEAEIVRAATLARVHEFVSELDEGYQYHVGENGAKLSGGQRQRISVARAILKNAPIIVLDEATAFVDPENESQIQEGLAALIGSDPDHPKTLIVVAHRLSTITEADQILVIDAGRLVAQGTHRELVATHDLYRTLWDAHQDAQNWQFDTMTAAQSVAGLNINRNSAYDMPAPPLDTTYNGLDPNAPILKLIFQLAGKLRPLYYRAVGFKIIEGVFVSLPSFFTYIVLIALLSGSVDGAQFVPLMVGLVGVYVGQYIFNRLAYGTLLRADSAVHRSLRLHLADTMRRLPLGFFTRRDAGTVDALFTTNIMFLEPRVPLDLILITVVTPMLVFLVMLRTDWRLALVALIGFPLAFLVLGQTVRVFARVWEAQMKARTAANSRMVEYIQGIGVIRAFNLAGARFGQFTRAMSDYRIASTRTVTAISPAMAAFMMTVELGMVAVLIGGALWYLGGSLTAETYLLFMFLGLAFFAPLMALGDMLGFNRIIRNSVRNINEFLKTPLLPEPVHGIRPNGYDIAFDGVTFGYDDHPVLNTVSFTIPEKSLVALVGPSGSGKTTITSLIARFWDVTGGSIRIGGVDVRAMTTDTLLSNITMVFQDVYLFNDTVLNNIRFGNPNATDEQVFAAARAAQCHDFIVEMPEGYLTVVGEGGGTLSGGQKQRISIARAILKDAPIVLLDEATASIDPENERLVQQAFNALTANKTLIVIAHRLNTVQYADNIIVLDEGRVVQQGTHSELIGRDGMYRRFWQERQKARSWKLGRAGDFEGEPAL
jgi:ABC-type multidrug transport system fused ATPase/permease subunit